MNIFKRLFRSNNSKQINDSITDNSNNNFRDETLKQPELTEREKGELLERFAQEGDDFYNTYAEGIDPLIEDAARLIVQNQIGSTSLIQRRMKLGYNRAGRLMDQLQYMGIVGEDQGSKARNVLIKSEAEFEHFLQTKFKFYTTEIQVFYENNKFEIEKKKQEYQEQAQQQQIEFEKKLIRQELLEKDRKKQLQREVYRELLDNGAILNQAIDKDWNREPIPQEVMDKVWNRDGGKCVKCGCQEHLEFDHIIPFSKGGANTYRNLQILCKKCNIEKSSKIG